MNKDKDNKQQPKVITDWNIHSVSLVSHCPYCGTDNWDKPVKKPNGEICNHPTKLAARGSISEGKRVRNKV